MSKEKRIYMAKLTYDPDVNPDGLDPCCACIHEGECLATDDFCGVAEEFWRIWEKFSAKMDRFVKKVNKQTRGATCEQPI